MGSEEIIYDLKPAAYNPREELAFLFGGHMADLVDRNRVIEILEQMRDRRKGSCSRQAMIEATAMQYAIEVVKKVPNAETQQVDGE